jgi:hypothetical protein
MFFFQSNVLDEEDWLVRRKEMFTKEPTRPFYIFTVLMLNFTKLQKIDLTLEQDMHTKAMSLKI